jgi:hypothetical protein
MDDCSEITQERCTKRFFKCRFDKNFHSAANPTAESSEDISLKKHFRTTTNLLSLKPKFDIVDRATSVLNVKNLVGKMFKRQETNIE